MPINPWTREELILAFNLYMKIPFGKYHRGKPDVIQLAKLIDRSPSVCYGWLKSSDCFITSCFNIFNKKEIDMPVRSQPDKAFLERHREEKFVGLRPMEN